jgi:hypothetical protein
LHCKKDADGGSGTHFFFGQWHLTPLPSSPPLPHAFFAVAGLAAELVAASDMLISWLLMDVKKDVAADDVHTELLSKLKLITSLAPVGAARGSGSGTGTSMWNCSPLGVWSNWKLFCFFVACCCGGWNWFVVGWNWM